MSSLVGARMSDLYGGPLNYSRGASVVSSAASGFSSPGLISGSPLISASCGNDFRRASPCMTSTRTTDLDPNFPSDYTSDDSSGSADTHIRKHRGPANPSSHFSPSANRNRKRARRPEMELSDAHCAGAYNSVVAPKVVRQTANARERDRTHSVNSAFVTLRTMIPTEPADRKLSKIETLRLATSYISHLHTMLVVGLDVREQPCLKHQALVGRRSAAGGGRGAEEGRSTSVCTFCLTASKAKNQPLRPEQCMFPDRRIHLSR